MGAVKDWMHVAFAGCFWGAFMLLWSIRTRKKRNARPYSHVADVFSWALMGLWFGLVTTFGWQTIHAPFVYLTIAAFAGSLVVAFLGRPKSSESGSD